MFGLKVHQEQIQTTRGTGKNPFSFTSRRFICMDSFKACGFTVSSSDIHAECVLLIYLLKAMERISKENCSQINGESCYKAFAIIKIQIPI